MLLQEMTRIMNSSASENKLMIEDVFSTTMYTGTGANQEIVTGVNLTDIEINALIRLQASDASATDSFGNSVALSLDGDTLAVGAYLDNNSGGSSAGSVYIFTRYGSIWTEQTRLQASDAAASDRFGNSISISSDGNTIAIGAYYDDTSGGVEAGSVYIFTRTDSIWTEQTRLQASDTSASDYFGRSVSISSDGNTLAVGSYFDDNSGGTNAGSVYIFTRSGSTWSQQTRFQASNATGSEFFGQSVAISSDASTLAVGAYADDNSGGADAGSVYIFTQSGGIWTEQTRLQALDAAVSDQFGFSVSISSDGNTLAIGAHLDNNSNGTDSGSVYIFTRSGSTWTQQTRLQAFDASSNDYFGYSVALSSDGNTFATGAYSDDNSGGTKAGAVYIFNKFGSVWTQQTKLQASDAAASDYFGNSVALSSDGKTIVVGAYQDANSGGADAGSVYTYGISSVTNEGMVWLKSRSAATDHAIYDTVRGPTYDLASNLTTAQTTQSTGIIGFNHTGISIGPLAKINTSSATYSAWMFKTAPKFFDIVEYNGNNAANRHIPHSLGCIPGFIIIKRTNYSGAVWCCYHRSIGTGKVILLNDSGAAFSSPNYFSEIPTSEYFSVSDDTLNFNSTGGTYVAYIFAHDDTEDSVIKCGSFTTDSSGNATVDLEWEPQYLLQKSTNSGNWFIADIMRGMPVGSSPALLRPNLIDAESNVSETSPSATGYSVKSYTPSQTYIYIAIRRGPMRVPTDATKVFNSIAGTSTTPSLVTKFPVDMFLYTQRTVVDDKYCIDRLRGNYYSSTNSYASEVFTSYKPFDQQNGVGNQDWARYFGWLFRRAPGFFDQVAYTGTGVARTIPHNLKSIPGMIWVKNRTYATNWVAWHKSFSGAQFIFLNSTLGRFTDSTHWESTPPTAYNISVGTSPETNTTHTYTAYLFGDTAGLCKAFSYIGNGSNQNIALGFVPRFVLIKRIDVAGDWKIFDATRGIVSGNDPVLSLNTTSAEITTTDPIDPISNGFNITQESTNNLNVNASTYIGWASA